MYEAKENMLKIKNYSSENKSEYATSLMVSAVKNDMLKKMEISRNKGRGGWWEKDCSSELLWNLIYEHVDKEDYVDVMNLIGMLAFKESRKESVDNFYEMMSSNSNKSVNIFSDESMVNNIINELEKYLDQFPNQESWFNDSFDIENMKNELRGSLHSKGWVFLFNLSAMIHMKQHAA